MVTINCEIDTSLRDIEYGKRESRIETTGSRRFFSVASFYPSSCDGRNTGGC